MPDRLGPTATQAAGAPVVRLGLFAHIDTWPEPVRAWSGVGRYVWDGQDWTGVGTLGQVSSVEETVELRAAGARFVLSGIPNDLLDRAMAPESQGRSARLWIGFMDEDWDLLEAPVLLFSGRIDTLEIVDGARTASIVLTAENRLRDLERAPLRRFTAADQRAAFPGDKGLDHVLELQEAELDWGAAA